MKCHELAWEQFVDQPIYKVFDFFPAGEPRGDNAAPIGIFDPLADAHYVL